MPSKIVVYKSTTAYYVTIFAVAIVWVFIGAEQAYITLVSIIITPIDWLFVSTVILVTMIFPVVLISTKLKQQVIFTEPSWEFRIRDVEISEFTKIMKDYKKSYSSLMSQKEYVIFILFVLSSITSILFPLLVPFSITLLIWGPYIFSGLILASIFLLAMFVFKATPNSATPYFHSYPEKPLRNLVDKLWETGGISWAGISLTIGEAGGYFIIQEVKAIGRIEGIESVGSIEITKDDKQQHSAISKLHLGPVEGTKIIALDSTTLDSLDVSSLVHKTIIAYVEAKGVNELLEDVMLDLGISVGGQETDVLMSENNDSSDESRVVDSQ